jgi:hypothetical protein
MTTEERLQVVDDLNGLFVECSEHDWDGYGALPVQKESFLMALSFNELLPENVPCPGVSVDPDGDVVFEWADWDMLTDGMDCVSISMGSDGILYYAAIENDQTFGGTVPWNLTTIHPMILGLLNRYTEMHDQSKNPAPSRRVR